MHVSNVIKRNREFTKSPPETFNYQLDILSPVSQQTENHATRSDQRWARLQPFGDLEDQDQIITKMWSWRSNIRSPKHCDLEDQDHFTFSTQTEVAVMMGGGGGGEVSYKY